MHKPLEGQGGVGKSNVNIGKAVQRFLQLLLQNPDKVGKVVKALDSESEGHTHFELHSHDGKRDRKHKKRVRLVLNLLSRKLLAENKEKGKKRRRRKKRRNRRKKLKGRLNEEENTSESDEGGESYYEEESYEDPNTSIDVDALKERLEDAGVVALSPDAVRADPQHQTMAAKAGEEGLRQRWQMIYPRRAH